MKKTSLLACLAFVFAAACHPSAPPPLAMGDRVLMLDAVTVTATTSVPTTDARGVTLVYRNAFEAAPGPEWSFNNNSFPNVAV